eukprot:TRINITY_DN4041_c0_g1_i1.p1 TRINITY_DN4041_c0_g1~~TRINITY_DN4041_c0_g1_i1.p1  ORF type:complete len:604 (+),score=205.24 TRINITY_DN4041_c0_g1_i1:56-1813(+)
MAAELEPGLARSRRRCAEQRAELRRLEEERRAACARIAGRTYDDGCRGQNRMLRSALDEIGSAGSDVPAAGLERAAELRERNRRARMVGSAAGAERWRGAEPADLLPGRTADVRGVDREGQVWPLTIRRANADGTYSALASDGKGQRREWPDAPICAIQCKAAYTRLPRRHTVLLEVPRRGGAAAAVRAAEQVVSVLRSAQRRDGVWVTADVPATEAVARLDGLRVGGQALSARAATANEDALICSEADGAASVAALYAARRRTGMQTGGCAADRLRDSSNSEHLARVRLAERSTELLGAMRTASDAEQTRQAARNWRSASAADVVVGEQGVYRAVDANRQWWPITVTQRNRDGTYSADVHNPHVRGGDQRWDRVHLSNIETRVCRGDAAAEVLRARDLAASRERQGWDAAEAAAKEAWAENTRYRAAVDRQWWRKRAVAAEDEERAALEKEAADTLAGLKAAQVSEAADIGLARQRLIESAAVALLAAAAAEAVEEAASAAALAAACHEWETDGPRLRDNADAAAAALIAVSQVEADAAAAAARRGSVAPREPTAAESRRGSVAPREPTAAESRRASAVPSAGR